MAATSGAVLVTSGMFLEPIFAGMVGRCDVVVKATTLLGPPLYNSRS
jgi:hypothetical protein